MKTVLLKGNVKNAQPNMVFFPAMLYDVVTSLYGKNTVPRLRLLAPPLVTGRCGLQEKEKPARLAISALWNRDAFNKGRLHDGAEAPNLLGS